MSPISPRGVPIYLWLFPIFFIGLWVVISYVVGVWSGRRLLAKRFRAKEKFKGNKVRWFQASMRWGSRYGNALNAGASYVGLYLAPVFLFHGGHPPLFIPWNEIRVASSFRFGIFRYVTFTLGGEEQIPFRISQRTARKLRSQAGAGWPDPQNVLQL